MAERSHFKLSKLLPRTRSSQPSWGSRGRSKVSSCSLAYSPAGLAPPPWFLLLGKGWGGGGGNSGGGTALARGPALGTGPDPWSPPGGVAGRNLAPTPNPAARPPPFLPRPGPGPWAADSAASWLPGSWLSSWILGGLWLGGGSQLKWVSPGASGCPAL